MAEKNTSTLLILMSDRRSGSMAQWSEATLFRWRKLGCNWVPTPACLLPFFLSFIVFLPFGFLLFILTADPVSFARFFAKTYFQFYALKLVNFITLTLVSLSSVLLLIIAPHHEIVKVLRIHEHEPQASESTRKFDNVAADLASICILL